MENCFYKSFVCSLLIVFFICSSRCLLTNLLIDLLSRSGDSFCLASGLSTVSNKNTYNQYIYYKYGCINKEPGFVYLGYLQVK